MLSIVLSEDADHGLVSARNQLRIGTEALWESEERYRRMVEDIFPLMVFPFSSDGRLTYANSAICAHYDRGVKEMLGLPVLTAIDLAERDRLWAAVLALSPENPYDRAGGPRDP